MQKRSGSACAVAVIAAVLALAAGPASASAATTINVFRCAFADDGSATVTADQPVTLHLGGYADGTPGLIHDVLLAQTTTLQVDDTTYDLSHHWSAPMFDPAFDDWVITQPDRPLGTLTAGQTVIVTYDITFRHPVAVLFPPVTSSGNNGPFVITGEGAACAITAT